MKLIEQHNLESRVHERGGEREVRFLYQDAARCLPVWHEGRLKIVRWGCRRGQTRILPCTGWVWKSTLESGYWSNTNAVLVAIPVCMGFAGGVWYRARANVRGLLVEDEHGQEVVFMVCEPSTHYYQTMTKSRWMPVFVEVTNDTPA